MAAARVRVAAESGDPISELLRVDEVLSWGKSVYNVVLQLREDQGDAWTFSVTEQKPGALQRFFKKVERGITDGSMRCRGERLAVTPLVTSSLVSAALSCSSGGGIDPVKICEVAREIHDLRLLPRIELGEFVFETNSEAATLASTFEVEDACGEDVTVTFLRFSPTSTSSGLPPSSPDFIGSACRVSGTSSTPSGPMPAELAHTSTEPTSEPVEMTHSPVEFTEDCELGVNQELVHSVLITKPKLKFLKKMPDVLRQLQSKMGEVHSSLSLHVPRTLDKPVVRIVRDMTGDPVGEDDKARATERLNAFLEELVQSDSIAVPGVSPQELAQDEPLLFLGSKHGIDIFVPGVKGLGQGQPVKLKATQLFIETSWTEAKVKSYALEELQVTIHSVFYAQGRQALAVIDLKAHRDDLEAAKARLLRGKHPQLRFLRAPQEKAKAQPAEPITDPNEDRPAAVAVLVHLKGNEAGRREIENYLRDRAVETRLVRLAPSQDLDMDTNEAMSNLIKRQWSNMKKQLSSFGDLEISKKGWEVLLKGKADAVQDAGLWLEERVGSIKVLLSQAMTIESKKYWLRSTKSFLNATINGAAQPCDEISAGGCLVYTVDDKTGVVRLTFFPEDEHLAKQTLEELGHFQKQYLERYWRAPAGSDHGNLWRTDYGKLRKQFQLSYLEWEECWLIVCGDSDRVQETVQYLTDLCQPEPSATEEVSADRRVSSLLRAQPQAWQKLKQLTEKGVTVTPLPKGAVLLRLSGPSPAVQKAKERAESMLKDFEGTIRSRLLPLSAGQLDYLNEDPEGKQLRRMIPNQVLVEDTTTPGKLVAMFRLPNDATLEVRQGDAVAGGLEIEALVNSANAHLLRGNVGGIAGAIKAGGGQGLTAECEAKLRDLGPHGVAVGQVMPTQAHELASAGFSFVLHAVPPCYKNLEGEEQLMLSTVRRVLSEAEELKVGSLVMPMLGTGNFGWRQNLDEALTLHANAIADWGSFSPSALKRVVIMDQDLSLVQALSEKLANFDKAPAVPPRPESCPLRQPTHAWFYWDDDRWVAYDYDQVLQLEDAENRGQQVVRLCGDRNGRPSISKNVEDGEQYATYNVDFGKSGKDYCAMQVNRKSGFERKVKKVPLESQEQAFANVPLYHDRDNTAKQNLSVRVAAWEAKYGTAAPAAGAAAGVRRTSVQDRHGAKQMNQQPGTLKQAFGALYTLWQAWGAAGQAQEATPAQEATHGSSSADPAGKPRFQRRVDSSKPIFSAVDIEQGEGLRLTGIGSFPENAEKQLLEKLAQAEVHSQPLALSLEKEETAAGALANFHDFLAGRDLVHVQAQLENGKVVLKALGQMNLLKGEKEFEAWQRHRAQVALQDEAERNRVRYPSEGWFQWEPVSEEDAGAPGAKFYSVIRGSEEWQNVVRLMRDQTGLGICQGLWSKTVIKVERIQNPLLWKAFHFTCRNLEGQAWNNGSANLLWAKHGTGKTDPRQICEEADGLDKNFSNPGMFGKALYVAEDARYSDDRGYCYDCPDGSRQMLLCLIAAGKIKEESFNGDVTRSLVRAPEGHNSIRGDVVPGEGYFALMLYRDYQVYPAYLVTFKPS